MSRNDIWTIPNVQTNEEAGQVRNAGSILQDLEQFLRKVYSACKAEIRSVASYEPAFKEPNRIKRQSLLRFVRERLFYIVHLHNIE